MKGPIVLRPDSTRALSGEKISRKMNYLVHAQYGSNNMNRRKTPLYIVDVQQKKISRNNYLKTAKFTQFRKIYTRRRALLDSTSKVAR